MKVSRIIMGIAAGVTAIGCAGLMWLSIKGLEQTNALMASDIGEAEAAFVLACIAAILACGCEVTISEIVKRNGEGNERADVRSIS